MKRIWSSGKPVLVAAIVVAALLFGMAIYFSFSCIGQKSRIQEITFADIPWGSSVDEVQSIMNQTFKTSIEYASSDHIAYKSRWRGSQRVSERPIRLLDNSWDAIFAFSGEKNDSLFAVILAKKYENSNPDAIYLEWNKIIEIYEEKYPAGKMKIIRSKDAGMTDAEYMDFVDEDASWSIASKRTDIIIVCNLKSQLILIRYTGPDHGEWLKGSGLPDWEDVI
ncbi:hypothetical protein J7K50_02555 [bacterium]|nr:hypothetical protein [bacterium]